MKPQTYHCRLCRKQRTKDEMYFDTNGDIRYCKSCWSRFKKSNNLLIRHERNKAILKDLRRNGVI